MKFDIIFTNSFKKQLKKLKKKYPRIKEDLYHLLKGIEEGDLPGDPIPGLLNRVYKVRCASSNMKRGKSGGYRVIYYLEGREGAIYLLTIYAKAEKENIPVNAIRELLQELGLKFK